MLAEYSDGYFQTILFCLFWFIQFTNKMICISKNQQRKIQYRSKILGPKYVHITCLRVNTHASVSMTRAWDTRRIGYYSIVIQYYTSCRSVSCLYWHKVISYYPLAKARLVSDVKVNFISNKSLKNGAFPFSSALNSYLIREKNNSKLPVTKSSKESVRCHTTSLAFINLTYISLAKSCVIWHVKMNFKIRA